MAESELEDLVAKYNFVPNRALGQNFLISQRAVFLIAEALALTNSDLVLEIGAGSGQLSKMLYQKAGGLIAIELDKRLEPLFSDYLSDSLAEQKEIKTIWSDYLQVDFKDLKEEIAAANLNLKIAGNLPYYQTTEIIIKTILEFPRAKKMLLMVQREAAARITASAGSKEYGPLSVLVSLYGQAKQLQKLSPQDFWPRPKIYSVLFLLTAHEDRLLPEDRLADFLLFLKILFSQRRKQLQGRLRKEGFMTLYPELEELLISFFEANNLPEDLRAEILTPAQILQLYMLLLDKGINLGS